MPRRIMIGTAATFCIYHISNKMNMIEDAEIDKIRK